MIPTRDVERQLERAENALEDIEFAQHTEEKVNKMSISRLEGSLEEALIIVRENKD